MARTISTFFVLQTPVTFAPNDFAICTTWFELRDVLADCFHLSGHVNAESRGFGFPQPEQYAKGIRLSPHEAPVQRIDGSRANFDQDFVVARSRLFDVLISKNIGRTIGVIADGFHHVIGVYSDRSACSTSTRDACVAGTSDATTAATTSTAAAPITGNMPGSCTCSKKPAAARASA